MPSVNTIHNLFKEVIIIEINFTNYGHHNLVMIQKFDKIIITFI